MKLPTEIIEVLKKPELAIEDKRDPYLEAELNHFHMSMAGY